MTSKYSPKNLERLHHLVDRLRKEGLALEAEFAGLLAKLPDDRRGSASNLLHYMAVRRHDVRDLQRELHCLGLSSLGRMEPYVAASLDAVCEALIRMGGLENANPNPQPPIDFDSGHRRLAEHAELMLGASRAGHCGRIMVTMPSEAAQRYELVRDLLDVGMDLMRINTAKDGPEQWRKMLGYLKRARDETGRPCRVEMDLAGPNPRTGPLENGPAVVHWWPNRNELGRVDQPADVWVTSGQSEPKAADTILPVDAEFHRHLRTDDELQIRDTRGRRRTLRLVKVEEVGAWAEADSEAYVSAGAPVHAVRDEQTVASGRVGDLPDEATEQVPRLSPGDTLIVTPAKLAGHPARRNAQGEIVEPAQIGCTLSETFRDARVGERILFDDGDIGGVIREKGDERLTVEIEHARGGSSKLKSDKGINLPDTNFELPAFTEEDLAALDFIVEHADMVGQSFIRRTADVDHLVAELKRRGAKDLGIVLKIETRQAFEALPQLLLASLCAPPVAVMIARGDLGVEMGFERLAEVQEEILWLSEAAHVPVIWATQVLETLSKKGIPSRGEVTDAALSGRAECVMLNKGEHVVDTIRFLSDVLKRMQDHREKKRSMLRKLSISELDPVNESADRVQPLR